VPRSSTTTSTISQSDKAVRRVERLLTLVETAQFQQKDLLKFRTATIAAHRTGQAPAKLLTIG
jgi:hypothetical protein